jgi:hypothetical protein
VKLYLKPRTLSGLSSLWLLASFVVLFALSSLLVAFGQRGGPTFFSNLLLTVPSLLAILAGLGTFFTGLFSLVKSRERSLAVFFATLVGMFVFFFIFTEVFGEN